MPSDATMKFRADISQLKAAMQQASRSIKVANSEFKAATAGMDKWSSSATGLQAKLKQLNTVLKSQKTQLSLAEKELEKTEKAYGKDSAATDRARIQVNKFKAEIAKTEKDINKYGKELDKVEKESKGMGNAVEDSGKAAKRASDGFTVMKGALANLVADGFRYAIRGAKELARETFNAGANFEAAMSKVEAVSGANQSEMDQLTAKAKEMGETTKFSATESAEAFNYMSMAGWKTSDMLNGIEGVMNLAAASGADLATTSDIVTDALTAMGYQAGDAGKLADVMAAASSNANTNVEMMGSTFQYAAPLVGALGYSMEDTAVAIGLMANAGVKGDKAGTALRSIFTRLASPPKEAAKALDKFGISLTDSNGKMKPFNDVMVELREKFAGLSETEKTQAASAIAGKNAMSGLLAIVNASPTDFAKLTKAVKESDGAARDMADTMNDNVSGQITLLKSKVEGIMIKVFEKAAPKIRKALTNIDDALDSVNWNKIADGVGDSVGKAVNFFSFLLKNGRAVINTMKAIGVAIGTAFVVNKVATFTTSITTLITTYAAAKTATEGVTVATKALTVAQMALPWVAVAAGAGIAIAALVKYGQKQKDAEMKAYQLTKAQKESIEAVKEDTDALKEMNKARDESVANANGESTYLSRLKNEYNGLIDKNGEVKKGYEDRADFIITTLADSFGVERSEIEKNIGKNGELGKSIDDLIEKQRAQAILTANEEKYNTAIQNRDEAIEKYGKAMKTLDETEKVYQDTQKQTADVMQKYNDLRNTNADSADRYYRSHQKEIQANDEAKASYEKAKKAVKDAEQNYIDYNTTIENYEGLSSAIVSGDTQKINQALSDMQNGFVTSRNGTKQILEQQVKDYEDKYYSLKAAVKAGMPGVTQEEVDQAKNMVDQAKKELDKLSPKAKASGQKAGKNYASGVKSETKNAKKAGNALGKNAVSGEQSGSAGSHKKGSSLGAKFASGVSSKSGDANKAGTSLASQAKSGAESKNADAYTSGTYFSQGFINGIGSLVSSAFSAAKNLAKKAWEGLKKGQDEGSPSKLTYKSGVFFTQGYINGIASQQKNLVKVVTGMVKTVVDELGKMSDYNFAEVGQNASEKFAEKISAETTYMMNKISYQNESKLKNFDKKIKQYENARDKKLDKLEDKRNKTKNKKAKARINKQIKSIKNQYKKLIDTQNRYKNSYQTASQQMISDFQNAVNAYQTKAQALIDSTISGITDKYDSQYNELLGKQDNLIEKLKSAGDLFEISGAGVMTINDINEQTKQIKDYTDKLAKIKAKVSTELFDQISSYDMKEGSAFMDRLLSMSANDLNAYNKAYSEKLKVASERAQKIYANDFSKLKKSYSDEIAKAFDGIDKQLQSLGNQAMKGFVNGLTKNTNYMSKNVKTFVKGMVNTFKSALKIKSPSRVMFDIGEYTGEGFNNGLMSMVNKIQDTASMIAGSVSMPLDDVNINGLKSRINQGTAAANYSNIVNNYNLVQNNNSPKALTALETYQARRQQISMLKAAVGAK